MTDQHVQTLFQSDPATFSQVKVTVEVVSWLHNEPSPMQCVSQGEIYLNNFTCYQYHAETEVADQTCFVNWSQYAETGPSSPSADSIMPDAWQACH